MDPKAMSHERAVRLGTRRDCLGGVSSGTAALPVRSLPVSRLSQHNPHMLLFGASRPELLLALSGSLATWLPIQFGLQKSTHGSHLSSKLALPTCSCTHPPMASAVPLVCHGLVLPFLPAHCQPCCVPQWPPLAQLAFCKSEPGSPASDALQLAKQQTQTLI